ncbi:hypothetical protein ABZ671_18590 [Micromonospora sp. NPDC006766]|uniref:hypothetical protein n=1 Tax=Micromonospora sp. NPDC006766 TaxID=3154778 RepID=UPI0033E62927
MTSPLPPLIVPVDRVARLAGLDPADEQVQFAVEAAIRAATVAAEGHLRRFVSPLQLTQRGVRALPAGWPLQHTPTRIVSVTAETGGAGEETGYYTVVYETGLDAREPQYGAIREWVAAAAQVHPAVRRLVGSSGREVRSVSAEGQSVSYEPIPGAAAAPTAGVPPMSSMDMWRSADGLAWQRPDSEVSVPGEAATWPYVL